ncbi:ABC transporter substrate-binding protein [Actinomycetes bacterium KLBMP 9759]
MDGLAAQVGRRIAERYHVDSPIGAGGMGAVFLATDELLGRTVALKQVLLTGLGPVGAAQTRMRVMREARAAARLHHPNVVSIFDVVVDGDEPWLVLEYVPSRSLDHVLVEDGTLDPFTAARVGRAVAAALAAAHAVGIVHRDVKPANVLLGDSGEVKLTDFGIARIVGDASLVSAEGMVGTPAYFAPEVARGGAASAASDMFGLGATLYKAVEGAPPFGSTAESDLLGLLARVARGDVRPATGAGPLGPTLSKLLATDPAKRPSAAETVDALGKLVERQEALTTEVLPGPIPAGAYPADHAQGAVPAGRSGPRRRGPLVGLSVALVAALVTTVVLVGRARTGAEPAAATPPTNPPAAEPSAGPPVPCDTSKGELAIGLIMPLSGPRAGEGAGVRNSVQLAVDEANTACRTPGYRLALTAVDDASTAAKARTAAKTLAAQNGLTGVIGTFESDTGRAAQSVLGPLDVVQISPSNRADALTRGEGQVPRRPFRGYFRLSATDTRQAAVAAEHAVMDLGKRSIAVVHDGSGYGSQLGTSFADRAAELGATVVARERVAPDAGDYAAVAAKLAALRPDLVFFGGDSATAGPLSAQLGGAGVAAPLMGGHLIVDKEFVPLGGREGDMAASPRVPAALLTGAEPFLAAYGEAAFDTSPSSHGPYGYDAAQVLVSALARVLATGDWSEQRRAELVDQVQRTDQAGVTGALAFDEFGDVRNQAVTIFTVSSAAFVPTVALAPR